MRQASAHSVSVLFYSFMQQMSMRFAHNSTEKISPNGGYIQALAIYPKVTQITCALCRFAPFFNFRFTSLAKSRLFAKGLAVCCMHARINALAHRHTERYFPQVHAPVKNDPKFFRLRAQTLQGFLHCF